MVCKIDVNFGLIKYGKSTDLRETIQTKLENRHKKSKQIKSAIGLCKFFSYLCEGLGTDVTLIWFLTTVYPHVLL